LRPDLPRPVAEIVRKAMARKPEDRFGSALEMRAALLAALDLGASPSDMPLLGKKEKTQRDPARAAAPIAVAPKPLADDVAGAAVALASPAPAPDQDVAPLARRGRPWAWLAAAIAMAGVVLWLSQRSTTNDAGASPREPKTEVAPPPAPPVAAPAPVPPPPPSTVAVELRGVPAGARVTVDGEVSLQAPLRLPRDGSNRLIRVSAKGKTPWQVVHRASADGAYEVVLPPVQATSGAATAPPRARKHAAAHSSAELEPPQALRRLDF
jgi:serine/threonine-protein kinase